MNCPNHPMITDTKKCSRCQRDFCKDCLTLSDGALVCGECKGGILSSDQNRACTNHPMITETKKCSRCQKDFCSNCLIEVKGQIICASCKSEYLRDLQTGSLGEYRFAGFWIRLVAVIIDNLALWIPGLVLQLGFPIVLKSLFSIDYISEQKNLTPLFFGLFVLLMILSYGIITFYYTYLHGKYGQSLGKMVCRIKVINQDGTQISYLKAFARYWAFFLSQILLEIGCIMAGFDEEKKSMHDRMCSTYVIYKER